MAGSRFDLQPVEDRRFVHGKIRTPVSDLGELASRLVTHGMRQRFERSSLLGCSLQSHPNHVAKAIERRLLQFIPITRTYVSAHAKLLSARITSTSRD